MALDPVTAVVDLVTAVIGKFPDPAMKAQALLQLEQIKASEDLAQLAADQEEAKNENIFISGWRPFIGWTCGAAFAYHFIVQPFLTYILAVFGYKFLLPVFDMSTLSTVLMGMLGLGSLRTVERIQGMK